MHVTRFNIIFAGLESFGWKYDMQSYSVRRIDSYDKKDGPKPQRLSFRQAAKQQIFLLHIK